MVAALGCGNSLVGPGPGSSGGHGGLAGAGGAASGSTGAAGHGGLAGAGGAAGGSTGAAGHGGLAGAGGAAGGSSGLPTCLQDLFAACGLGFGSGPGYCNVPEPDSGSSYSVCFESDGSYGYGVAPPCSGLDGGTAEQVFTAKKPDGSTCFVQHTVYGGPQFSGGVSCYWTTVSYAWTDATGSTVATAEDALEGVDPGHISLTCTNGGTASCTYVHDPISPPNPPCPTLSPECGTTVLCPSPRDAASQ